MVLAMSCIGIVDALAKYLGARLHGVQVAWGYFFAMWIGVMLLASALPRRVLPAGMPIWRTRHLWLQMLRALCLVGSLSLLFSALRVMPLAEATVISFTSPLFVVALAGPILHESVGWRRWLAVLSGLGGALLVIRPGSELFVWAALLPLFGAVFFAAFTIITRLVSDPPATTLFYTSGVGAMALTLGLPFTWLTPNSSETGLYAAAGCVGLVAHLGIVRAMQHADASVVAPINYVRLVWAISIGIVVFGDWPHTLELVGGAIIVVSGLYVVYGAARSDRAVATTSGSG